MELVKSGRLTAKIAENTQEIRQSQQLRHTVFCEEMGATHHGDIEGVEQDDYDDICDHLLIYFDDIVVGSYRLLKRSVVKKHNRSFYTETEYNIDNIKKYQGEVLELGRSCVSKDYRRGAVIQFLWRSIASYVVANDIKVMFGCGSFPSTDIESLKVPLSYLYHNHLAPKEIQSVALPEQYVDMDLLPKGSYDDKQALAQLPPLIKGYLRLAGTVGDGAVIDKEFNTTDICIIVETSKIHERYVNSLSS